MKTRIAWVLGAVLAFVVLGCAPEQPTGDAPRAVDETAPVAPAVSEPRAPVILATTTSTQDTGLLDALLPVFEKESGYEVKPVAVGSGEALEMGRRGEADVLLVHAPEAEEKLMAEGRGVRRLAVMHNDFVLVGPKTDPAKIAGAPSALDALRAVVAAKAVFVSRADESGTHKKEKALWQKAGVAVAKEQYLETGQGMGATLRVASEKQAYTLSDRGTFTATENLDLAVLSQGDPALLNPYHVIEVRGGKVNAAGARALTDFFVAAKTQEMIRDFTKKGQKLFVSDALPAPAPGPKGSTP